MQLETLVDKHDAEILNIKDGINEIATDVQLLVKDYKFLADKMSEIGVDIRELLNLAGEVRQSRHDIIALNREVSLLKENYLSLQEKFRKIDILAEKNNKIWDNLINRWLRIVAILVPVATALAVIYFK
jgi:hypothetical protein